MRSIKRVLVAALIVLLAAGPASAQVSFVDVASGGLAGTTTTTVTIPAGTQTNDVLFLVVTSAAASGTGPDTPTDDDTGGNAWAAVTGGASTSGQLTTWWKRATGSTASKTITIANAVNCVAAVLTVYRNGEQTGDPYLNVSQEDNAGGDQIHAGFTATNNGAMINFGIATTSNDLAISAAQTATAPGALSIRANNQSTGGNDCAAFQASEVLNTAGATGNFSWTQTSATTRSVVWEIKPESVSSSKKCPGLLLGFQGCL
jgi:hypothetical protein